MNQPESPIEPYLPSSTADAVAELPKTMRYALQEAIYYFRKAQLEPHVASRHLIECRKYLEAAGVHFDENRARTLPYRSRARGFLEQRGITRESVEAVRLTGLQAEARYYWDSLLALSPGQQRTMALETTETFLKSTDLNWSDIGVDKEDVLRVRREGR